MRFNDASDFLARREAALALLRHQFADLRLSLSAQKFLEILKLDVRYRPNQPRVPAGSPEGGQWTEDGGGGNSTVTGGSGDDRVRVAQAEQSDTINVLEEDALGGHTFAEHIGKSQEYLSARITGERVNIPYIFGAGRKRAGSFNSLAAANKLVNSVLSQPENQNKISMFKEARYPFLLPVLYLFKSFSSETGYEAYSENSRQAPRMRSTTGVAVRLVRTNRSPKGYYVDSAWPMNED